MDYQVSARKYRPGTFDDVIGQPHVVQTLTNSIASKRIAHAFLFSGTRGVGKTTVARILAKALNCEQGPTGTPCNSCANCLEITQGTSVDVVEIDGASNTSVDDVREIRENVKFTPFRGQYRVYIIDEVHMAQVVDDLRRIRAFRQGCQQFGLGFLQVTRRLVGDS